jgi:hypothetical protein
LVTAEGLSAKALNIGEQSPGIRHSIFIHMLIVASGIRVEQGLRGEAAEMLRRAQSMANEYMPAKHPVFAAMLVVQAKLLRIDHRNSEARKLEEQAATIARNHRRENAMEYVVDVSDFRSPAK